MAYATVQDVQARLGTTMTEAQQVVCQQLLEDAAILIDAYNFDVLEDVAKVVSCRMVARAIGTGGDASVPMGASQGSMSALGYSQSWTLAGGAVGEVYLTKAEKKMLGVGDHVGSWSPVQEFACEYNQPAEVGRKVNVVGAVVTGEGTTNVVGLTRE